MRLIIKLLLLTLVVAAVLPFITLGPNGSALLKPPDLNVPDFDVTKISELVTKHKPASDDNQSARVHKWRDSDGHTHYTSDPPPQGIQSEMLSIRPDTNVVPAVKLPQPSKQVIKPKLQKDSVGSVYSPGNPGQLIDDARNVQNVLNDRANELQQRSDR